MQRVLSFPNARGFGDSAGEFVTKRMCFSFMFAIGFLALVAGFLFGRFSFDQELALTRNRLRQSTQKNLEAAKDAEKAETPFLSEAPFGAPLSEEALLANQRALEAARVAPNASQAQAIMLREFLKHVGFDFVSPLRPVSVALAFPHPRLPNRLHVLDAKGHLVTGVNDSRSGFVIKPEMNVTVGSLNVQGLPVYVNFGRAEDYLYLDSIGITVAGHVVLVRAGGLAVTDLVATALDHDAIGVVLYLDPAQADVKADIVTARELAALKSELSFASLNLGRELENVPILVVTAADAELILQLMAAKDPSPGSWRGSLKSQYPIGPGFSDPDWKLELQINTATVLETRYDVVAAIRGIHEPDRLVVIGTSLKGNDENSAALMELSKQLGTLKREKKWRPHRSIVVAYWGENSEKFDWLTQDVVAYLDMDFTAQAVNTVLGSPLLQPLFERTAASLAANVSFDVMIPLGNAAVLNRLGIPFIQALDYSDSDNETDSQTISQLGALWGELAVEIASHEKLPFSLTPFVLFFNHTINTINNRFEVVARRHKLFLESLTIRVTELIKTIETFNQKWLTKEESPDITIRAMNDQLVSFSHALSCPIATDSNRGQLLLTRHLLLARSDTASDSETGMGELQDLLRAMSTVNAPDDLQRQIVTLFTDTMRCLKNASIALSDKLDIFISGYS